MSAVKGVIAVKAVPAFFFCTYDDLCFESGANALNLVYLICNVAHGGAHNGADSRLVEAVLKVVCHQLIGSRDGDGAELMESNDREPELIVTAKDEHYTVALLDAESLEVVGALV